MKEIKRFKVISVLSFIICLIDAFVLLVILSLYFVDNIKTLSASDVFNLTKSSIVEIKADSDIYWTAYGSAVCIDENLLITNAHILFHADQEETVSYESVSFRFYNSTEYYPVTIIDYDIDKDLCLLELDNNCESLKPIIVSSEPNIQAGDKVYAVGNALNHGIGISEGIISIPYINIDINDTKMLVIQCDIVIASGSSGGALLDENGQLIGLTTFRVKDQNGYIVYGVGFAIPTITIENFLTK